MNPGKPSAAAVQSPRVKLLRTARNNVSVIAPTLWLIAEKSADCLPIVEVTETNKHMEEDLLQIESRGVGGGEGARESNTLHKPSSAHETFLILYVYSLCM